MIIAMLSDEAREAQVMQAKALLEQRKIELEAKRRLIELNAMPRLELANLEAQFKVAEAGGGHGGGRARPRRASPRRGPASSPTLPPRSAPRRSRSPGKRDRADRRARSDAGGGRSVGAQGRQASRSAIGPRCGWSPARRSRDASAIVSKSASQTTRTYRVEVEMANADGAIPDGITAEVAIPLDAGRRRRGCRARR